MRTSPMCQEHDGKVYELAKAEVGVNYPPLHPWCRSTIAPEIDGISHAHMKRWARDPKTGEDMKVPRDMTYTEWLENMKARYGVEEVEFSRKALLNERRDEKQFGTYKGIIGKENLPDTLEAFQRIKYTEPEKWWLLKGYAAGVRKGDLSTLTSFDTYQAVAGEVKSRLVGMTTVDGLTIQSYKTHFIDRLIGNYEIKREGVGVEDAKQVLLQASRITNRMATGNPSRSYWLLGIQVTVNPDTQTLIQTNPSRKAKK